MSSYISIIVAIAALTISYYSLLKNISNAGKNILLATQQALFKIVTEKAKDCNNVWAKVPENMIGDDQCANFDVVTELHISLQVVEQAFFIFSKNHDGVNSFKDEYHQLFYNQLTPDLRNFIKSLPWLSETKGNNVYSNLADQIYSTLKSFFENSSLERELQSIHEVRAKQFPPLFLKITSNSIKNFQQSPQTRSDK